MNRYLVSCTDRQGMQHGCTFDAPDQTRIIRSGWQEAKRLCGHVTKVASAYIYTLDGKVVGTLR